MVVSTRGGTKVWQRRDRNSQLKIWAMWMVGTAIFMWSWQQISAATTWMFFFDAPRIAADIGGRAMPPRWGYINTLWEPLWDTLNIATLGTIMALVMAVPVAFLAARNTTPSAVFVRPIALLIIVSTRSINSLIWAL
jgi:phosphonate transport system permease protein